MSQRVNRHGLPILEFTPATRPETFNFDDNEASAILTLRQEGNRRVKAKQEASAPNQRKTTRADFSNWSDSHGKIY